MIAWQNPAAFAGLLLLAGPVVIHLLRRRQAPRIVFPTVRFVDAAPTGAVRLRGPSDLGLLLLRLAILGVAVCAMARPVVLTSGRVNGWNARAVRAIVVDTSESMTASAAAAREAADAERQSAHEAIRIDTPDLREGLRRAAASLPIAQPGRREIVLVSDFQAGLLADADIAHVPRDTGLRFHRVGTATSSSRTFAGLRLFGDDRAGQQNVTLEGSRTIVDVRSSAGSATDGLQIVTTPEQADAIGALMRAVAVTGAAAPAASEPLIVIAGPLDRVPFGRRFEPTRISAPWMIRAVLRLRHDDELTAAAREVAETDGLSGDAAWVAVARSRRGEVVVRAAADGIALAIHVATTADSYLAAAVVRGALSARSGDVVDRFAEHEVLAIAGSTFASWSREASPVAPEMWRQLPDSDARWCWLAALGLLLLEAVIRRQRRQNASVEAQLEREARVA